MGLKDRAKALLEKAGVAVVPGFLGDDQSAERLAQEASAIGYPILIKAVAGGGGKGMRRVDGADEFAAALEGAKREANAAFGDDRVLVEKYVSRPRHVEVQVRSRPQKRWAMSVPAPSSSLPMHRKGCARIVSGSWR